MRYSARLSERGPHVRRAWLPRWVEADALLDLLLDRVEPLGAAGLLVLAAYQGEAELREALADVSAGTRPEPPAPAVDPPAAYLTRIAVTSFRGIGPTATLHLQPGPGLTLVVGRNGSGKSSFAEAAEVALTGRTKRWEGQSSDWVESWRNLHGTDAPAVRVELAVDGTKGTTSVERTWTGTGALESSATAQLHGSPKSDLASLGWAGALETYRPFLSYSELGAMLAGKRHVLYDALFSILGLSRLVEAQDRLRVVQKAWEDREKSLKSRKTGLLTELEAVDDQRAVAAAALLVKRAVDLDAVSALLHGDVGEEHDLTRLRATAELRAPDPAEGARVADLLEQAATARAATAGTSSERARSLIALLEAGLAHTDHSGEDCPLCGTAGALGPQWAEQASSQVEALREDAVASVEADRLTVESTQALEALVNGPPGSDEAWAAWRSAATKADPVALRTGTAELAARVAALADAAAQEITRLEDHWRPVAERLGGWHAEVVTLQAEADVRAQVDQAFTWLRAQSEVLRNERMAPLAAQSAATWKLLRQESNVELGAVSLAGTNTQRRVTLDVSVDGATGGAALGVMSQGELHALALSLFLPRATLPESPFRFLVVDDPVQAMDPSKVDGLARALAHVARTHQVVVFTHDDRLAEATRRLQLNATTWQVVRREGSVVEVVKSDDPVTRYLQDARAVARTSSLPEAAIARVVPGLCRSALEAACHAVLRRTRLAGGSGHADVEDLLASCTTTTQVLALALFGDKERGSEVMARLNGFGGWAGDAFRACNKGTHVGYSGDLVRLVEDTDRLTRKLS